MSRYNDHTVGVLLALLGALLFSTKAVFVKLAYQYDVDTITLLLLRMSFALPFYLVVLARLAPSKAQAWKEIKPYYWAGILLAGFLGYYLSSLLDFLGLRFIDASVERLILFIYPTIIALLSYFFFGERLSKFQVLALLSSYIGLLFVFGQHLQHISLDSDFWKGASLIILCAITFAAFLVMSQWLIPRFGVTSFTSLSMTFACVLVIVHFAATHVSHTLWTLDPAVYLYGAAMAILATVLPSYIVNAAIDRIGAVRAGIISSVGPISTITLAYWLLDERLAWPQMIGAALIIASVTVVSAERKKRRALQPKARARAYHAR